MYRYLAQVWHCVPRTVEPPVTLIGRTAVTKGEDRPLDRCGEIVGMTVSDAQR